MLKAFGDKTKIIKSTKFAKQIDKHGKCHENRL